MDKYESELTALREEWDGKRPPPATFERLASEAEARGDKALEAACWQMASWVSLGRKRAARYDEARDECLKAAGLA